MSKKRHYLVETVPSGPNAAREAEKVRTRLLNQVDEKRNPRTKATMNQLMGRYLEVLDVEPTTRGTYEGYIRNHIRPLLGDLAVGRLDGEVLDSFYAVLRACRAHCGGRKYVEHRSASEHECDGRCRPHKCRPLADSSIRQIHGILSGACKRAVRWRWIGANPIEQAEPPSPARPDPHPPTPEQAARIAAAAWQDLDWGMLVWLALMTGARRGELCALRWDRIDFATGVLTIRSSIAQSGAKTWEKDTKTHQQRRITLDDQTMALLRAYLRRCTERAAALGFTLPTDARVFSLSPDGRTWLKPDTVTQRYARMCARLGWDMNIHQLRHYSATELIAAGVDVRTVAGRLGHGGGGSTTLRVYSAWVSEADQRAAGTLAGRMPALPAGLESDGGLPAPLPAPITDDSAPYLRMVADLRAAIKCGALRQGDPLPPMVDLAARYEVAPSTAHRAVAVLAADGEVVVSRGKRAIVAGL
ncbi:tyrosine-type recombinase/integrase [Micromonospora sp. B11E3]|uniref:tyrosine-type recombinase/integrase n=1 Tax=Micromonospora sp. B11E3 TaxID=3153562 RepID=UPI00325F62CC